jgi:hypothetical protein
MIDDIQVLPLPDSLPKLPNNADEMITLKVKNERESLEKHHFGTVGTSASLRTNRNGRQLFAVFGNTAYELIEHMVREGDKWVALRPALLDGKAFHSYPDEGMSGTLHWICVHQRPDKWMLTWYPSGWLHSDELEQSAEQIGERIVEEIGRGEAPITGFSSKPEYQ